MNNSTGPSNISKVRDDQPFPPSPLISDDHNIERQERFDRQKSKGQLLQFFSFIFKDGCPFFLSYEFGQEISKLAGSDSVLCNFPRHRHPRSAPHRENGKTLSDRETQVQTLHNRARARPAPSLVESCVGTAKLEAEN